MTRAQITTHRMKFRENESIVEILHYWYGGSVLRYCQSRTTCPSYVSKIHVTYRGRCMNQCKISSGAFKHIALLLRNSRVRSTPAAYSPFELHCYQMLLLLPLQSQSINAQTAQHVRTYTVNISYSCTYLHLRKSIAATNVQFVLYFFLLKS